MTVSIPKIRLARVIAALVLAAGILAGGVFMWAYSAVRAPGPLQQSTALVIERGAGLREIASKLETRGIVDRPLLFVLAARLAGAQRRLKAGEYAFERRVSIERVIEILREGQTVIRRLTIAEGLTSKEIVKLLEAAEGLKGDVKPPPEGSLLPNTYHFSYGDSREEIVARMSGAMTDVVAELWAKRASGLPLKSPREAVILASIVEKETAVPSERARIAAVFLNRMRKGMRIESDPTVVYGLTNGAGGLGRALTRADLKKDHPYNTYRIPALPPGPICNPGRDSLAAVMNPILSDEFFFVADGTGGHVFARTLKEHNRNVARWRKLKRQRKRNSAAPKK